MKRFNLFKRTPKTKQLVEVPVPIGHLMYSWLYGGVAGCTCQACTTTWDLENSYIKLEPFLKELLDKTKWDIKWKK